jgi:hypothetical protein
MKIAAYHKAKGDVVGTGVSEPDLIYISIVFSWNKWMATSIPSMHPGVKILVGGPGYDPVIRLPHEIEIMPPDHSLYPDSQYAVGRVTSGCIRYCHFCIVPKLEPEGIRYIQSPSQIWDGHRILRLLDDNILAHPKAFEEVYSFCVQNKVILHMEYWDVRLINKHNAPKIVEMKHDTGIWFSWDMTKDEKQIQKGIESLLATGVPPSKLKCFLYIHDESQIVDGMYRWRILREYKVEPFLMVNMDNQTPRLKAIHRRGCRPAIWRGLTPEEVFA